MKEKRKIIFTNTSFGIEIEFCKNKRFSLRKFTNWYQKKEETVKDGVEITTKQPLKGESATDEIYRICNCIDLENQKILDSCGGHVHVSIEGLNSIGIAILSLLYSYIEKIIYSICNPPGEKIRIYAEGYARATSGAINDVFIGINLNNKNDLNEASEELRKRISRKCYGYRFSNIYQTIEWRMSNEPHSAEDWIDNANLYIGIVEAVIRLSKIYENGNIDLNFERIKQKGISDEQKLELLLELIGFPEEYKEVYRNRFKENYKDAQCFLEKPCNYL